MKRERQPQAYFTIGIAGLFLAGFFLLVTFGASTYRDAVESQSQNNRMRALLSYLSTCVHANDHKGALALYPEGRDGVDGPVLAVYDRDSGYAVRLYQWKGNLVEDYAAADAPLSPEGAQVLGETGLFQVEEGDGLWRIKTDEGELLLRTRSTGEVAHAE
ncbi:DUF4860 domain-containing protein [bacterium D16-76]|nr:DUF4860 domain-containing protein [bacterium D16-76]